MIELSFSEKVALIEENLATIKTRMVKSAEKGGREAKDKLVAVTKLLPLETIKAGIAAGLRDFGENYPEQAYEKIRALAGDEKLTWHMIGPFKAERHVLFAAILIGSMLLID